MLSRARALDCVWVCMYMSVSVDDERFVCRPVLLPTEFSSDCAWWDTTLLLVACSWPLFRHNLLIPSHLKCSRRIVMHVWLNIRFWWFFNQMLIRIRYSRIGQWETNDELLFNFCSSMLLVLLHYVLMLYFGGAFRILFFRRFEVIQFFYNKQFAHEFALALLFEECLSGSIFVSTVSRRNVN